MIIIVIITKAKGKIILCRRNGEVSITKQKSLYRLVT